jgi:PKD repeat protein
LGGQIINIFKRGRLKFMSKALYKFAQMIHKLLISFTLLTALSIIAVISGSNASAVTCNGDSVISGGVTSASDLINKYNKGDGCNSASSIAHFYSYFGISSTDIQSINTTEQMGNVTSSGDVYLNKQLVATNAITAGRENSSTSCGGSTKISGGFYTRPPCASFLSSPLSALVVMKNGVFQFAILTSCGNPVKATPKTTTSVGVMTPTPTPKPTPAPAPPAPTPTKTIETGECNGNTTNSNSGGVASQGGNCSINTTIVKTTTPTTTSPSGQCSSLQLQVDPNDPLVVTAIVASETTNGSQLQSITYNFGDNKTIPSTTQSSMSHTYTQAGNYTVEATVAFLGSDATTSSSLCQVPIEITNALPTCNELNVTAGSDQTATISQFETNADGSTFTGADVDWGDGNTQSDVNPVVGDAHQYASPETYTVTVTPHFNVNGQDVTATSDACQQQITFSNTVTTTSINTSTTPVSTSLVNTGTSGVIGIFIGAAGLSGLGYHSYLRRRLNH